MYVDKITMKCHKCGYDWDYKGDPDPEKRAKYYTSCPRCRANIKVKG